MPSETYHLFNIDDEKVTLQLNEKMIHPFSKFMLAHKWYSCNMLTLQSKLLMDSIIDRFALSRRARIR
jgi:hypothetical protein